MRLSKLGHSMKHPAGLGIDLVFIGFLACWWGGLPHACIKTGFCGTTLQLAGVRFSALGASFGAERGPWDISKLKDYMQSMWACARFCCRASLRLVDESIVAGTGGWALSQPCNDLNVLVGLCQVLSWISVAFVAVQGACMTCYIQPCNTCCMYMARSGCGCNFRGHFVDGGWHTCLHLCLVS